MMDILVFDVGLGQCIFVYPRLNGEYSLMIDCGHSEDNNPIPFLKKCSLFKNNELGQLIITNYDQDHFSNIKAFEHYNIKIRTVRFSKNISSSEIRMDKSTETEALAKVLEIKDTYTVTATNHKPPYVISTYSLSQKELDEQDIAITTNNLSQIVFIEYLGTKICICGDIEEPAWQYILNKRQDIWEHLINVNILVASHHGRENGYCERFFNFCNPECVIISDKPIIHKTQEGVVQNYAKHVDEGIFLNGDSKNLRKVLTTRNDGNILIRIYPNGIREYKTFSL